MSSVYSSESKKIVIFKCAHVLKHKKLMFKTDQILVSVFM